MNTPSQTCRRAGFSLVEILVVVTIICVLMGLLLVAVKPVMNSMRTKQAQNTCVQIVTAVKAYHVDYGKFPLLDPNASTLEDTVAGDPNMGAPLTNNTLFYTLRNIPSGPNQDYAANPQRTVYFQDKVAKVNAQGVARTGFFDQTANGGTPPAERESCLYDPWGRQYGVIIDGDGDGRIDLRNFYTDFSGVQTPGGRAPRWQAGAFSMGTDERLGMNGDRSYRKSMSEKSDDVISWE